ncbi:MAG: response regulator transcription factor [Thermodesulfobacteriota bacterium]
MRVLLLEDDPSLGASLEEYLRSRGFDIQWLADDREFNAESAAGFDVLVLDLILKHGRGEDLLRSLRSAGYKLPVLVLTAKADLGDKKLCFELGADDYLTKPFEPLELVLRIKALLRRDGRNEEVIIGDARIDLNAQIITRNGREEDLPAKAWELLKLLIRYRGELVPKNVMLQTVWPDVTVGDDVVRHYIGEIRKVIPPESIVTHKARGYRLDI